MFLPIIIFSGMLFQVASATQAAEPPKAKTASSISTADQPDPNALLKVRRIYVDSFGDDLTSRELQSMIVSSLVGTKRFRVTENRERADAVLKGVALEKTSQEVHAYGEGTSVGAASGGGHSQIGGSNGSFSGSSGGGFVARHMGTEDSSVNTETVNDARIAVRLVNPDGDVIWTTTQESKGAKYKGASADVADKCVQQLLRDFDKLEGAVSSPAEPSPPISAESKK